MAELDKEKAISLLNRILEQELAGVPADVQSAQIGARISNEGSVSRQQCDSSC